MTDEEVAELDELRPYKLTRYKFPVTHVTDPAGERRRVMSVNDDGTITANGGTGSCRLRFFYA